MSIAAFSSSLTTILSSQEHTVDCSVADNDVYTVYRLTVKDLVFKNPQHKRLESLCSFQGFFLQISPPKVRVPPCPPSTCSSLKHLEFMNVSANCLWLLSLDREENR